MHHVGNLHLTLNTIKVKLSSTQKPLVYVKVKGKLEVRLQERNAFSDMKFTYWMIWKDGWFH